MRGVCWSFAEPRTCAEHDDVKVLREGRVLLLSRGCLLLSRGSRGLLAFIRHGCFSGLLEGGLLFVLARTHSIVI